MAILRAGPWGNLTESFNDVPSDTSVELDIFPVNCAKDDWPNQAWAAYGVTSSAFPGEPSDAEYGVVALGESLSKTSDGATLEVTPEVTFIFCYQATGEFDVTFNWEFTGDTGDNFPSLFWTYETLNGRRDSFFDTPLNSGSEVITLPPATFGQVTCNVMGYLVDFDNQITLTASLS